MAFWPDVHKGDRIERPAQLENDVRHLLNRLDGFSEKSARAHSGSPAIINVWNASGAPLEAGAPVAFDESEFLAEDALPVRPVTSESTLFAILTSYLDEDAIGAAIVSGAAKVRLSKRPASGEIYARPLPNSPLVAPATSGYARILRYWQDQDEESKEENWHAIILLSGTASASSGMFTIILTQDKKSQYATVLDTTLPRGVAESSDAGAGIAHINNQPYKIKPEKLDLPAASNTKFIYLHLNASKKSGDASKQSNVELDGSGTVGIKVTVKIEATDELKNSTFADTYYLIGRITARRDGEPVTYTISQDHKPGNLYMLWHGEGVGIGEEISEEAVNE